MHLNNELKDNVAKRFSDVIEKKNYKEADVEAGREYVKAYVSFLHYTEEVYRAIGAKGEQRHNEQQHRE